MPYSRKYPRRRSPRLPGFDYGRSGFYFVTICTRGGVRWFDIPEIRAVAGACWFAIPEHHPFIVLDAWVVMPNHIHGILEIVRDVPWKLCAQSRGAGGIRNDGGMGTLPDTLLPRTIRNRAIIQSVISPQRRTLSVVIRSFKGAVTKICRRRGFESFAWHGRYHDAIIRSTSDLNAIRRYILDNPRMPRGLDVRGASRDAVIPTSLEHGSGTPSS